MNDNTHNEEDTMAVLRTRQRRFGPPREDLDWVTDLVARRTAGEANGSLRIDWDRLKANERDRLLELTKKASDSGSFMIDSLGKRDRTRWEHLVEKATSSDGYFQRMRDEAEFTAEMAKLAQMVRRPARRVRYEQQGSIRLPRSVFTELHNDGKNTVYTVTTLGLLAFLMLEFENATAITYRGFTEGSGDDLTLVIDGTYGIGERFDPLPDWRRRLAHLESLRWFTVEWRNNCAYVMRGPRALKLLRAA